MGKTERAKFLTREKNVSEKNNWLESLDWSRQCAHRVWQEDKQTSAWDGFSEVKHIDLSDNKLFQNLIYTNILVCHNNILGEGYL